MYLCIILIRCHAEPAWPPVPRAQYGPTNWRTKSRNAVSGPVPPDLSFVRVARDSDGARSTLPPTGLGDNDASLSAIAVLREGMVNAARHIAVWRPSAEWVVRFRWRVVWLNAFARRAPRV
jgi:hypothetical protein